MSSSAGGLLLTHPSSPEGLSSLIRLPSRQPHPQVMSPRVVRYVPPGGLVRCIRGPGVWPVIITSVIALRGEILPELRSYLPVAPVALIWKTEADCAIVCSTEVFAA
jgi:hypothetical protein